MKKNILIIAVLLLVAAGCHNSPKTPATGENEGNEMVYNSPEALFNAIGEQMYTKQAPQESIKMVDRLVTDYPEYENNPVALFMLATFVYDEQLHDLDKARETFQRVIDEYPGTPFADDAAIAITQLGMTPEELVRMFEEAENGELKTEN